MTDQDGTGRPQADENSGEVRQPEKNDFSDIFSPPVQGGHEADPWGNPDTLDLGPDGEPLNPWGDGEPLDPWGMSAPYEDPYQIDPWASVGPPDETISPPDVEEALGPLPPPPEETGPWGEPEAQEQPEALPARESEDKSVMEPGIEAMEGAEGPSPTDGVSSLQERSEELEETREQDELEKPSLGESEPIDDDPWAASSQSPESEQVDPWAAQPPAQGPVSDDPWASSPQPTEGDQVDPWATQPPAQESVDGDPWAFSPQPLEGDQVDPWASQPPAQESVDGDPWASSSQPLEGDQVDPWASQPPAQESVDGDPWASSSQPSEGYQVDPWASQPPAETPPFTPLEDTQAMGQPQVDQGPPSSQPWEGIPNMDLPPLDSYSMDENQFSPDQYPEAAGIIGDLQGDSKKGPDHQYSTKGTDKDIAYQKQKVAKKMLTPTAMQSNDRKPPRKKGQRSQQPQQMMVSSSNPADAILRTIGGTLLTTLNASTGMIRATAEAVNDTRLSAKKSFLTNIDAKRSAVSDERVEAAMTSLRSVSTAASPTPELKKIQSEAVKTLKDEMKYLNRKASMDGCSHEERKRLEKKMSDLTNGVEEIKKDTKSSELKASLEEAHKAMMEMLKALIALLKRDSPSPAPTP